MSQRLKEWAIQYSPEPPPISDPCEDWQSELDDDPGYLEWYESLAKEQEHGTGS